MPRGPRVHWFVLDRQVSGHEDDNEDNNLRNERLATVESIVINGVESEVRQEVEGNNLGVNAGLDYIESSQKVRSGLFEHFKAKMYNF